MFKNNLLSYNKNKQEMDYFIAVQVGKLTEWQVQKQCYKYTMNMAMYSWELEAAGLLFFTSER